MSPNHTYSEPVKHDNLGRYLDLAQPAPFVWVRVHGAVRGWELLWQAMRDPEACGGDVFDPYPRHLASGPQELSTQLTSRHREALLSTYDSWIRTLPPVDCDDDFVRSLADQVQRAGIAADFTRARHRFSRELCAAFGKPSLALTDRDVLTWLAWAGLWEPPPLDKGCSPEGQLVGRITDYALRAQRRDRAG